MTVSAQSKPDALIVINGKVYNAELSSINPNAIESISVLKGQSAINAYGEAAKDGAIVIKTKDQVEIFKSETVRPDITKALILINGEVYRKGLGSIDPNEIQTISILKDASATAVYGEAGKNGVILITTKSANFEKQK
jgi:TonB-dependent SusC/RagA subfamily outer membrane receptor